VFLDRFGMEALYWEPATIALEIEEEFDVDLPQSVMDKLMVAINILTTDKFYRNLPDFIIFCNVLSGDTYRPDMFDPADNVEVAWGITEGLLIAPPEDDDLEPFSGEIRGYIGAMLDAQGIINPPDILKIAIRRANVSTAVNEFSDDPDMFNAIYDMEAGKTDDINNEIRSRAVMLADQLTALSLENGATARVARGIMAAVQKV